MQIFKGMREDEHWRCLTRINNLTILEHIIRDRQDDSARGPLIPAQLVAMQKLHTHRPQWSREKCSWRASLLSAQLPNYSVAARVCLASRSRIVWRNPFRRRRLFCGRATFVSAAPRLSGPDTAPTALSFCSKISGKQLLLAEMHQNSDGVF